MFNITFSKKGAAPGTGVSIHGKNIKLIVGLGNPGGEYKGTYHNVGSMFLDYLYSVLTGRQAEKPEWKKEKLFEYVKLGNIILARPTVYMNTSGRSVKKLLLYFKIKPAEILVLHDDSDIPLGNHKISYARGSAGHYGIESITKSIGTNEYSRLRLGVRYGNEQAGKFVLKKIGKQQLQILEKLFDEIKTSYFEV
ncbi:MAG: hypothetical protein A3C03_00555 [Candidatus Colwellbacteria bacterium RIFCSPHIGHO2_02_FULL_45_17]|uniref:Aminoacyl-tRNA hydrolase n=2 Tax=Candidatus Colwelliibacteriota TaxID=1817904 RepID=A0A1G1ZCQ3_9BACT|nr:MAG: hypothetical protein A3C03_00555 [Candidatus Colwellbacteria bacterium RIFCSPHIGHO2_02_FULL_45_17]OGY60515.1 MAG: hypothetical protein A3I33_02730 [Candidatus Colwellbacteria bacterium RIFCSPLOWO2_02_FULL_45_11]OGY62401.1 MAG: hypothetical protein A3G58_01110 [Candidatus Colwellbacteria bacterium RIFCSPLOWO2_12_FULL_46_17]